MNHFVNKAQRKIFTALNIVLKGRSAGVTHAGQFTVVLLCALTSPEAQTEPLSKEHR